MPTGTPTVDLTFDGASGTINGGVFMTGTYEAGPTTFSSFLEIRNNGTEQGYNTNGTLQYDTLDGQNSTHSILLANVPIVIGDGSQGTQEGVAYREFRLNIAESGSTKQFLSLDAFQIWQEESGSLTSFTPGAGFAGSHTNSLVYNLDAGGDHWVGLQEQPSDGNGAVQTEFTVLIPDSYFINDPAHRYVTLYSEFGAQAGWGADSGSEEWGLSVNSTGPTPAMTVHKTATVAGGTADHAGEVISYDVTVANVGDVDLTAITVTDPSVSNLAPVLSSGFNVGDTNHDNKLSQGETWDYTASYTVTQNDIDTLGNGTGLIQNTVTADSAETNPLSGSASVVVESGASVDLTKTADVTSADSAGDVIAYTLTVANTGNTTLTSVQVDDSDVNIASPVIDPNAPVLGPELLAQVLNGDFNVGDTNQNGVQDPGETFVYVNAGDTNQNGTIDPGETAQFTNIGDTNQNGFQDGVEVFQYYNAGDTNHDGVEDDGETFQFTFDHSATPILVGGFNAGDTNQNGLLDVGETWQYTVSYTVTQDDIDNGGVVQPGLTHDDTATVLAGPGGVTDSDTHSVTIVQDPHVAITKTAVVADGSADAAGDEIDYTIHVSNAGNMTLTGVDVTDPSVSNLTYVSGDTDGDGKLDLGESWIYTANHIVTQADIDNGDVVDPMLAYTNTVSVSTDQGTQNPNGDPDANASASASVAIVQNPHVTLHKTATVADDHANAAGDVIDYAITVANDGNMTLTGAVVSDPSVSDLAAVESGGFNVGDTNQDGKLGLGEIWQYTANHTVTQADLDNGDVVDPTLTYDNTASVTTAQGAADSESASVAIEQSPHVTLDKTATVEDGRADTAGDVIDYAITVTNDGNMTLTGVAVSDPSVTDLTAVESGGFNTGDLDQDGKLDLGETWQYTASHTVTQAEIDAGDPISNTASVTTAQGVSSSDGTSTSVGANNPVTITSGPESGSVAEQPNMTGSSSLDSTTPVPTGTLAFSDIDLSDVHSVSVALDSAVWSVGPDAVPPTDTFIDLQTALSTTLHDSTGSGSGGVDWTFSIADKDLDFLSAGETLTATYIVTVSDGITSSSQTVTITATGAEDALTANPVAATLADNPFPDAGVTTASGNLLTEGTSQGDASNTVTVTEINGAAGNVGTTIAGDHGTLFVTSDGTYTYTANSALDPLQDGDSATDHFTFTVMDSLGATATQSLDFNITGTNDLPQVTGGVFFGDVVQNAGPTTTVNGGFESGDLSGWFATSSVFAELLAFGPPLGNYDALLSGNGSLEQDVATTPGQHYQLSFYVAGDADASGTSFTAYWDGAPVLAQTDVALGFTHYTFDVVGDASDSMTQFFIDYGTDGSGLHFDELSVNPTPGPATESTNGSVSFSDAEIGDTHTANFTPDNSGYVGTFSLDPVSESAGAGSAAWHFSVDNADIAFLTTGETLTQSYTVAIADDHGGTTTQSVAVTIHANDFLV